MDPKTATGMQDGLSDSSSLDLAQKHRKACNRCHTSKLRCVSGPLSQTGVCNRCAKHGFRCIYSAQVARRKPVKTKYQRVAELERQVQVLLSTSRSDSAVLSLNAGPAPAAPDACSGATGSDAAIQFPQGHHGSVFSRDVVDRGLLTAAEADRLVLTFRTFIEGRFVGTWLPKGLSSSELRRPMPILWLSILCSSAASRGLDLSEVLSAEMDNILKERLAPTAEPSLEVLQATHNYVFHHYKPTFNRRQQFLYYLRLGINMIIYLADSEFRRYEVSREINTHICRELLVWYWCSMR